MPSPELLLSAERSLQPTTAEVLDLLRDDHSRYHGRGTNDVTWLRGNALLSLATNSLPEAALPFVLEELDNGTDARLIAVAARSLRSFPQPRSEFTAPLLDALVRIRFRDEIVEELPGSPTVVQELLDALVWLGPESREHRRDFEHLHSSLPKRHRPRVAALLQALEQPTGPSKATAPRTSCCLGFRYFSGSARTTPEALRTVELEDQTGATISFHAAFVGRPSIVAFFYTRCDNPLRCSLTISQLGAVQRLLRVQGVTDQVHVAGITYDPGFDLPARLRAYAEERGVELGGSCRMFRSAQFGILRNHFGLGVSFLGSLVNRHRIELFLLDPQGRTAAGFERFRWSPDEVATRAIELLHEPSMAAEPADPESRSQSAIPPLARSLTSTAASSIALVLLPKCPACWAAYASLAGFAGATAVPLPLVRTLLLAGFGISLLALIFAARASRRRASRVTQDSPL